LGRWLSETSQRREQAWRRFTPGGGALGDTIRGPGRTQLTGRPAKMSNENDLQTINGKPLHPGVKELCAQFKSGKMDRREFVRLAAFLGVSAASAYAFAGDPLGGGLVKEAAAQTPKKGGVLRVAMQVQEMKDPATFDWTQ